MKSARRSIIIATVAALALAGPSVAQHRVGGRTPHGGGGNGDPAGPGPGPIPGAGEVFTVEGTVLAFTAGFSFGTPQLVVADAEGTAYTFVLGPYRYLQAQGFAAAVDDAVVVTAFDCSQCEGGYAVVQVENLTQGLTLVLRDDEGLPLWREARSHHGDQGSAGNGGQGRMERGAALCGGAMPDMSRVTVYTGVVTSFDFVPGEGTPLLVLGTPTGEVEIVVAPYRTLAAADLTLEPGMSLEVTAAPVLWDGDEYWLAITLTDLATGLEVQLRDPETGRPLHGGFPW